MSSVEKVQRLPLILIPWKVSNRNDSGNWVWISVSVVDIVTMVVNTIEKSLI